MIKRKRVWIFVGMVLLTFLLVKPFFPQEVIIYCFNFTECSKDRKYCGGDDYDEDECIVTCTTGSTSTDIDCTEEPI